MKFNNRSVQISKYAKIGENVKIGDNTVIYDNVEIGNNCIIANNCILGEPLNDYYFNKTYENPKLIIGYDGLIRSHTIIYAGSTIGNNFTTGHRVSIREYSNIGNHCNIGTLCDIQGNVNIGNYSRFYSNVHIAQKTEIGNFVFMYPYSLTTNDPHPPSINLKGCNIGDYTQIAVHSSIISGVSIGENCLIAANSLVNRNIKDYSLVSGNPAKTQMDVRDLIIFGVKGKYYPWMYHYESGMPWEGIGFDNWVNNNQR